MDATVVGIDVSKDKLDIAVRPSGDAFSASRDAAGLDAIIARLAPLSPIAVAIEATGGFETAAAASLGWTARRRGESRPGPRLRERVGQARQD